MKLTDEELMAYADGELTPVDAKRIEAAMARDRGLAARVARFRSVRRALRTAYDSVISEPVPEHLRALLGDVAAREPTQQLDCAPPREAWRGRRVGVVAWAAIAGSLVLGALVGSTLLGGNDDLFTRDGLHAGAALTHALNTQLASTTNNQPTDTRIAFSFRARSGEVCRAFMRDARGRATSGFACRTGDQWAVRMVVSEPATDREVGVVAPAIADAVNSVIVAEPFGPQQEQTVRDGGWRAE